MRFGTDIDGKDKDDAGPHYGASRMLGSGHQCVWNI